MACFKMRLATLLSRTQGATLLTCQCSLTPWLFPSSSLSSFSFFVILFVCLFCFLRTEFRYIALGWHGICYVALDDLECLITFLPLCWDYKHAVHRT